ncbi:MAG TPA: outer membrane beta-barrel protein [Opitutaceae bacterium]|nr:outer membrane beta-barrel protein [Opitutaceae bacterium]
MTKHVSKFAMTATLLALAATASADVKVTENLSIAGYAVGSYTNTSNDPGTDTDRLDIDAVKTTFIGNFKPVTGTISLFYPGIDGQDVTVLDAFATYDMGGGYSITGGKFLSYLGYEAFDPINMTQITYAPVTIGTLSAIPAYHSGLRLDYSDAAHSFGVALLDSVYGPNIFKGDGELKKSAGFEGFYKYTGTADFTLWAGFAYNTAGNGMKDSLLVLDVWAQYVLSKQLTIAGEVSTKDGGDAAKGWTWLAYANYSTTDKVSWVFRVGGEQLDDSTKKLTGASDFVQYTVAPTYKVTENLSVRAEYSYYDYDNGGSKSFFGVQGLFKF